MCQDTPLTAKTSDIRPSAFPVPAKIKENGEKNQKSPRLPEQSHRADLSMRTKRPMTHNLVRPAAHFVFLSTTLSAGLLQANLPPLHDTRICLERSFRYEY